MDAEDRDEPINVLLIEDSPAYTYIIKDMLLRQSSGRFALRTANSLESGLLALAERAPDIILLDLGLPESSGFSTFQRVQSARPDSAVIILTAVDDDSLAMRAVRDGAQDFLVKEQVDRNLLVRAIRYSVERHRVERELRDLSGRLLKVQDEERRHMARELHDVTAQNLAALGMNLALLQKQMAGVPPRAREILAECRDTAEQCTQEVRTLSYLLHAPLLDELGLGGAIRDYADGFSRRSGIETEIHAASDFPRLPPEQEIALFRVVQESLNNIHRHSGSPSATIHLACERDHIRLEIEDHGRGLPARVAASPARGAGALGVGIQGMRERLRQLGGRLELVPGKDSGTCVRATLPRFGGNP